MKLNLEEIECSTDSLMVGFIEHVNYIASSVREGIFVTSSVSASREGLCFMGLISISQCNCPHHEMLLGC